MSGQRRELPEFRWWQNDRTCETQPSNIPQGELPYLTRYVVPSNSLKFMRTESIQTIYFLLAYDPGNVSAKSQTNTKTKTHTKKNIKTKRGETSKKKVFSIKAYKTCSVEHYIHKDNQEYDITRVSRSSLKGFSDFPNQIWIFLFLDFLDFWLHLGNQYKQTSAMHRYNRIAGPIIDNHRKTSLAIILYLKTIGK